MTAIELFSFGLAAAFVVLAIWTVAQWRRWRTRSTAYLAAAFVSLGLAIVVSRISQLTSIEVWSWLLTALNVVLAAFPWLVAASVWTLEGRRPRWAWIGLVWVPVTAVFFGFVAVTGWEPPTLLATTFIAAFGLAWVIAGVGSAVRLRRASRRHLLARPRMRTMAAGLLLLTFALVLDLLSTELATLEVWMNAVALAAAIVFLFGFLPPRALQLWWRRDTVGTFQQMQVDLLGAVSAQKVGEAVAAPVAEVLGSGVVVVEEDGTVLASDGLDPDQAASVAREVSSGQRLPAHVRTTPIGRGWLAIVAGPFTPVFGRDESDLVDAYALQVRISLERAALFESIQRQQADLEAMLLGLAHDIRSPTAAISGSAQMLADADDRDLRQQLSELIGNSTDYLGRLVDAMMELGQVRSGARDREPVALLTVAGQVGSRIAASHPAVTVDARGDDDAAVLMNPIRAEQLFENLVGNAVKHGGREDLTVHIEIRDEGEEVVVVVADDGVGVDPDDQQRIFAPFKRGRGARGPGHGLGLGLVRRIVDDLGGNLVLEPSERGARFAARFPTEHVPARILDPAG